LLGGLARRIDDALGRFVAQSGWNEGPVGVAVSGGGDSMALLLAAAVWSRASGRSVVALSVDHGLRAEAADEIALAAALAQRLGVAHQTLHWRPPAGMNVGQASARRARYRLLGEALRETGARVLLTAHTADDQAETVLMRAGPGVPAQALAGMRTVATLPVWPQGRGIALVRPFLAERRERLRDVLRAAGLGWAEDPSNTDPRHERSRIRAQIAAAPALRGHALRLAAVAVRRRALMDAQRLAVLARVAILPGGVLVLPSLTRLAADSGVLRRVLADVIALAGASDERARGAGIARVLEGLREEPVRVRSLGGALVWAGLEGVCFARDPGGVEAHVPLVPGVATVWDGRIAVTLDLQVSGWTLGPLRPGMPLPEALRRALRRVAPAARAGQAAAFDAEGRPVALPLLLPSRSLVATDLVGTRLADLVACLRADLAISDGSAALLE
jgi:tRNA(Ile)-lysidine synthase